MSFWKNVIEELEYQGKARKWLAAEASFDVSTIGTGLKREGMPQADLAIRIAKALNVSVEYLVTGSEVSTKKDNSQEQSEQIRLYKKYKDIIDFSESLSSEKQALVKEILKNLKQWEEK